ncbi:hypothetical protein [Mumia quercus]|uniref:hypothetical protein n=1 Tax=Mumia quercus TaxID=2976125 RepID=UPI0021D203E0|nr:hypothetical protein [Mumia quercus]
MTLTIDPHRRRVDAWQQTVRGGSIADRRLREVEVSLPPTIESYAPRISSALGAEMDDALREIAALDETHGEHLGSLAAMLLRAESVASSKIEHVEASLDDYARAHFMAFGRIRQRRRWSPRRGL